MRKRRLFVLAVLVALLVVIFLLVWLSRPKPVSPEPLVLSVQRQTLNFRIEEALPVDLEGDGMAELVLRDASTKRLFFARWKGSRWIVEPLPVPPKSTLPANFFPCLDTGIIPEGTMKGKELLKPLDFRRLPVLLPDGKVVMMQCDRKGNWRSQLLVSSVRFILAGNLNSDGQQNDLIIGVLPDRLLWFVAKNDALALHQETKFSRSGKAVTWGKVEHADISDCLLSIMHGNDYERYLVWRNRLVPDGAKIKRGDIDGDGFLDEVKHDLNTGKSQIWLSKSRKLVNLTTVVTDECFIGDVDNDKRDEVIMFDGGRIVCWDMQPSGGFKGSAFQKHGWFDVLGIGDVDGDGRTEAVVSYTPIPHSTRTLLSHWLPLTRPSPPKLLLVQKTAKGWRTKEVKIFSTKPRRQGYRLKGIRSFGLFIGGGSNRPISVSYFGGRWWLFVSSNCGTAPSFCFFCEIVNAFASVIRKGHFTCPHKHGLYWQETRFWAVKGNETVEVLRLEGILAHGFKFRGSVPEGVDLDGDGKGEAVLTKTLGKNAVFVARYRNERWQVGKVERPCRLVSLSLSHNPRPCLLAVWEDGTVMQIGVP